MPKKDNTYVLKSETHIGTIEAPSDMTEAEVLKMVNRIEKQNNWTSCRKLNRKTHHLCKYCSDIANGVDPDVLCAECRQTFGHAFFSEL